MGEKRDRTGKRVRPKTAPKGNRLLCSRCRTRSPTAVTTLAPRCCPHCPKAMTAPNPE